MSGNRRAIIVAARRTAIGKVGGLHRHIPLEKLAAPVIRAVLADANLSGTEVHALYLGNAAGGGGNPARLAALEAGLPQEIPALTIDAQCASGLEAISHAARLIETGAADIVLAGGAESPSTAPWRVAKPRNLYTAQPEFFAEARFAPQAAGNPSMIEAGEAVAREFGITRERQDAYAAESHRKALSDEALVHAAQEIVPVSRPDERDECPRPLRSELLARMPPLLPGGSVTAGNSCPVSDGAAFALLISEQAFRERGYEKGLRLETSASAGCDPRLLGISAVPAVRKLDLPANIETVAFVEAFASQVLATLDALGLDAQIVNPFGGAIALGHPYGASGAVLAVQLFTQLVRNPSPGRSGAGLALAAAAGGVGAAALFTRIHSTCVKNSHAASG